MTWSLRVLHGDLALAGNSLATATDEIKLVQDLRHWILENIGFDPSHPEYGSTLDGGMLPDGTEVDSPIGLAINNSHARVLIDAEIRRIVAKYQSQQLDRARRDSTTYRNTTLTNREVLLALEDVEMTQFGDTMLVNVLIRVGNSELQSIVFGVNNLPITTT